MLPPEWLADSPSPAAGVVSSVTGSVTGHMQVYSADADDFAAGIGGAVEVLFQLAGDFLPPLDVIQHVFLEGGLLGGVELAVDAFLK